MIIVRSPLRITLGGGGTDLSSYYRSFEGYVMSAAIDKYVYVAINRPFIQGIYLKYAQFERASSIQEVQHPIIRESLALAAHEEGQIEISVMADIPAGTGLGSSSSFATALIKGLSVHYRKSIDAHKLAETACHIEIDKLGEPIGKQDQFISAYGGFTELIFKANGQVEATPLSISTDTIRDLEDNLLLFFTGQSRSASSILKDQEEKSRANDQEMIENLHYTKKLGLESKEALSQGDTVKFAELMHLHWERKRARSKHISNEFIDEAYELAIANGAIGGKVVGAGGGGFLLLFTRDKEKLRNAMVKHGLQEVRFGFDYEGTKVILS